jgi:hypothetical protein
MFIFCGINKYGLKKFLFRRRTLGFFFIFFSMGLAFYIFSIFWNPGVRRTASVVISPGLLTMPYFWKGWFIQLGKLTGVIPFFLGIFLFFTVRKRETKSMISGLFLGYFLYGLIFSYATATHAYYQIALFSIIALMLGQTGQLIRSRQSTKGHFSSLMLPGSIFIMVILVIFSFLHQFDFIKKNHSLRMWSAAFFLVGEQGSFFQNNIPEKNCVENAQTIGRMTGHRLDNIFLSRAYGNLLKYYGAMFGRAWPTEEDFILVRLRGRKILRGRELYFSRFAKQKPRYFIVTDFISWEQQPDLQEFLGKNFEIMAEEEGFIIFDLEKARTGTIN